MVVRSKDLYEEPEELLQRLVSVLREHGIPVPAVLCDEWRRHFRDHVARCLITTRRISWGSLGQL